MPNLPNENKHSSGRMESSEILKSYIHTLIDHSSSHSLRSTQEFAKVVRSYESLLETNLRCNPRIVPDAMWTHVFTFVDACDKCHTVCAQFFFVSPKFAFLGDFFFCRCELTEQDFLCNWA